MAGLWSEIGFPHKGWRCVGVEDLKDNADEEGVFDYGTCEACGQERIRFVHCMEHSDYARPVEVGCICAGHLEQDYFAPRERERKAANRAGRRERWVGRKWKVSRQGGIFLKLEGYVVGISPDRYRPGNLRYWIKTPSGDFVGQRDRYDDARRAKLALFDELSDLLDW